MITTCLKYLIPISCFLFLGAVCWPLLLVWGTGKTTIHPEPVGNRAVTGMVSGVDLKSVLPQVAPEGHEKDAGEDAPADESHDTEHSASDPVQPELNSEPVTVGMTTGEVRQ